MTYRDYDMSNPDDLAEVVRTGLVWDGPGWAIKRAIDAINKGTLPMPSYIPEPYASYITRDEAPPLPPVEPMTGGDL